jgi:hypothetical protein
VKDVWKEVTLLGVTWKVWECYILEIIIENISKS